MTNDKHSFRLFWVERNTVYPTFENISTVPYQTDHIIEFK